MPVHGNRIHSWAVGWLGASAVRALHATWHVRFVDTANVESGVRDGSAPVAIAFWHRHLLTMVGHFRGYRVCAPVSEHQDGEYVAQVMGRFGLATVRGSTTRGSLRVVRGMLEHVSRGWSPAITPDGPRGPKYSVQPGVALLARKSGLPVVPVGVAVQKAWTFPSWDEFVVPKPWTRIVVVTGPPLPPPQSPDPAPFCEAVRGALMDATRAAEEGLSRPT